MRVAAVALAAGSIAACGSLPSGTARPSPPYNLLLISIDTVRQDFLGCYGHRPRRAPDTPPTPNLDALAADGVRMRDAYASSSWTLPSHVSMMTGEPPIVHGVDADEQNFEGGGVTLAEVLRRHGYRTAGVFSGPYLEPAWGFGRGFESYRSTYGPTASGAIARFTATDAAPLAKKRLEKAWLRDVSSPRVTAGVVDELRRLAREPSPWFVFAHYFDAHEDYIPPRPYDVRFDPGYAGMVTGKDILGNPLLAVRDEGDSHRFIRRASERDLEHVLALYEGEIGWVDEHVGKVLHELDALGLRDKTLVIVVADHGEEFFEHGGLGHHRTLYEESLKVPLLLRLPGALPAGRSVRGLVSTADLLPTVLDVLELPERNGSSASRSFLPLIRGTDDGRGRDVLSRLVTFETGTAVIDGRVTVAAREVTVNEAFRRGSIKIFRTRRWPQFPEVVPAGTRDILEAQAERLYRTESLTWIDVERSPAERDDDRSSRFDDPAARAALQAFQTEYVQLLAAKRATGKARVPEHVRLALGALGYVTAKADSDPPEPDLSLPPPGRP